MPLSHSPPTQKRRGLWIPLAAAGSTTLVLASLVGWLTLSYVDADANASSQTGQAHLAVAPPAKQADAPQPAQPSSAAPAKSHVGSSVVASGASKIVAPAAKLQIDTPDDSALDDGSLESAPDCSTVLGNAQIEPTTDQTVISATLGEAERALRYGNVKGAHAVFCKAVALDDQNFRAAIGLAQTLLIRRDAKAAAKWAQTAGMLPSEYPRRAKNILGDALARLGQIQEARQLWYEAGPIPNPSDEQLYLYMRKTQERAASAFANHDYHRAERLYRRVLIIEPDNRVARRQLVRTLQKLKQYAAALYWANIEL